MEFNIIEKDEEEEEVVTPKKYADEARKMHITETGNFTKIREHHANQISEG